MSRLLFVPPSLLRAARATPPWQKIASRRSLASRAKCHVGGKMLRPTLSDFQLLGTPGINPTEGHSAAHETSLAWASRGCDRESANLAHARVRRLCAHAAISAPARDLALLVDLMRVIFLLDDAVDDVPLCDVAAERSAYALEDRVLATLDAFDGGNQHAGGATIAMGHEMYSASFTNGEDSRGATARDRSSEPAAPETGMMRARLPQLLETLVEELRNRRGAAWAACFAEKVRCYIAGNRISRCAERDAIAGRTEGTAGIGTFPSWGSFASTRLLSSGGHMVVALTMAIEAGAPPPRTMDAEVDLLTQGAVAELFRMCCNHLAWANDVFSAPKEAAAVEGRLVPHNAVLVVAAQEQLPYDCAARKVIALCNEQADAFVSLRARIPYVLGEKQATAVEPLVDVMAQWMRANVEWSLESKRYK